MQDNYPELMWKTLIINAPTTFRVLWAMVRHLLDARTQAKIQARQSFAFQVLVNIVLCICIFPSLLDWW